MGRQSIHLYHFNLHVAEYDSRELGANSPRISLAINLPDRGGILAWEDATRNVGCR